MLKLFRKREAPSVRLVRLCDDGYCAVVGESFYQDALRATSKTCIAGPTGRRTFTAALFAEPANPYDANAVAIHSVHGKLGHLSRENAVAYRPLFQVVRQIGYDGGTCEAYLTGGEPGKPSFGVVLRLADPASCLAQLLVGAGTQDTELDDDA